MACRPISASKMWLGHSYHAHWLVCYQCLAFQREPRS